LCDLRKISLGKDAKPETLRGPGFLKSIFLLSGKQPAWTIVAQEDGGAGFMVRSTTHVETLIPKDSKVARLRTVRGDSGASRGEFQRGRSVLPLGGGAISAVG
jgi:hypothetical protein